MFRRFIVLLALALTIAACGDDGATDTSTEPPATTAADTSEAGAPSLTLVADDIRGAEGQLLIAILRPFFALAVFIRLVLILILILLLILTIVAGIIPQGCGDFFQNPQRGFLMRHGSSNRLAAEIRFGQTGFGGRSGAPASPNPSKLVAEDVADVIVGMLRLPARALTTETTLWATNPQA